MNVMILFFLLMFIDWVLNKFIEIYGSVKFILRFFEIGNVYYLIMKEKSGSVI